MFSSTISRQSKRNNRLNQISVHGGVVYLAGVTAADRDAGDMEAFNTLWDAWVPADSLPGRTTVHSSLASDVVLVEIVAQAAVAG